MSTTIAPLEERGVSCSLDNYLVLPDNTMDARIAAARRELGSRAVVLGHHYQRDEVIRFADFRGDSYKLAQEAARTSAEYIVFCGVHFMAESADVLAHAGPAGDPAGPQRRLLHGRHGGDWPGGKLLGTT